MTTLATRLSDLATRIATECKGLRTLINGNAADLSALTTTAKTNLVAAMNELKTGLDAVTGSAAVIDDASTSSTTKTYSVTKIRDLVSTSISALTTGAPTALDTLDELAAALGDDANFAATITTALGNRVRVDVNTQGLTGTQKQNARTNIDAYGSTELGNPDTNLVTAFETALT
jgi:hypothetical protein